MKTITSLAICILLFTLPACALHRTPSAEDTAFYMRLAHTDLSMRLGSKLADRRKERGEACNSDCEKELKVYAGEWLTSTPKGQALLRARVNYYQERDEYGYTRNRSVTSYIGAPLLGSTNENAYGPGIHSDATGRPFTWQPDFGGPALGPIKPNAYGPGIGMDATGRPVRPRCAPGMIC